MIEAGLISALGFIIVLMRFNLKRIAGYALFFDITITAALIFMFQGTYAGMMTGLFAGVIVSLFLTAIRKMYGYDRAMLVKPDNKLMPIMVWIHTPGRLS